MWSTPPACHAGVRAGIQASQTAVRFDQARQPRPIRCDVGVKLKGVNEYTRVSSGSPFEPIIGLSRAIRSGPWIAVSGTAPLGADGKTVHVGNAYAQARRCLEIIAAAIDQAGGSLRDVIRTRIMLTDISQWQAVARAHGEVFGEIRPANTVVQVVRFIDPEWLVEIEADCLVRSV